jgi:hypothetical protein
MEGIFDPGNPQHRDRHLLSILTTIACDFIRGRLFLLSVYPPVLFDLAPVKNPPCELDFDLRFSGSRDALRPLFGPLSRRPSIFGSAPIFLR